MPHVSDFPSQRMTYGPQSAWWNIKPGSFRKFKKALAKTRLGTADTKILFPGDSNTLGYGTSDAGRTSKNGYPAQLQRIMAAAGWPAIEAMTVPQVNAAVLDNRVASTGTWDDAATATAFGWASEGGIKGYWYSANNGATRTVTPGVLWDKCDIYYVRHTGTGTATFTPTGGAAFNLTAGAVTLVNAIVEKATVTASSVSAANTLAIAKTNATAIFIVGLDFYNSTKSQIRIANAGMASSRAAGWAASNASFPNVRPGKCIQAYQPDLSVISLGTNDANISLRTLTQYLADMTTVITDAQVSGDVLVIGNWPYGVADATKLALIDSYNIGLRNQGVPFIDTYNRMGSYATYNAAGYMFGDLLHGNDYSANEVASWVYALLSTV